MNGITSLPFSSFFIQTIILLFYGIHSPELFFPSGRTGVITKKKAERAAIDTVVFPRRQG